MKSPSLSRRIYNSSLTLALSFSFYALILGYTLSRPDNPTHTPSSQTLPDEVSQQLPSADSATVTSTEVVSYVDEVVK